MTHLDQLNKQITKLKRIGFEEPRSDSSELRDPYNIGIHLTEEEIKYLESGFAILDNDDLNLTLMSRYSEEYARLQMVRRKLAAVLFVKGYGVNEIAEIITSNGKPTSPATIRRWLRLPSIRLLINNLLSKVEETDIDEARMLKARKAFLAQLALDRIEEVLENDNPEVGKKFQVTTAIKFLSVSKEEEKLREVVSGNTTTNMIQFVVDCSSGTGAQKIRQNKFDGKSVKEIVEELEAEEKLAIANSTSPEVQEHNE